MLSEKKPVTKKTPHTAWLYLYKMLSKIVYISKTSELHVYKWVKWLIYKLHLKLLLKKKKTVGFSGGPVVKNPPCNTGTPVQSLVQGRSHVLWSN